MKERTITILGGGTADLLSIAAATDDLYRRDTVIVNSFNSGTLNNEFTISRFTQKVPLIRESAINCEGV